MVCNGESLASVGADGLFMYQGGTTYSNQQHILLSKLITYIIVNNILTAYIIKNNIFLKRGENTQHVPICVKNRKHVCSLLFVSA